MPAICCAVGCNNSRKRNPDLVFYSFPVDKQRRDKWLATIRSVDTHIPQSASCQVRFLLHLIALGLIIRRALDNTTQWSFMIFTCLVNISFSVCCMCLCCSLLAASQKTEVNIWWRRSTHSPKLDHWEIISSPQYTTDCWIGQDM